MSRTAPQNPRVKLFFKHFDQTFPENLIQFFRGILLFCLCFTLLHSWLFGFLDENVGKIGPLELAVEGPNRQKTYGLANPWFPAIGRYIYPHHPCKYTIHGCYGIDSVDVLMQLDDQLAKSPARCIRLLRGFWFDHFCVCADGLLFIVWIHEMLVVSEKCCFFPLVHEPFGTARDKNPTWILLPIIDVSQIYDLWFLFLFLK